MAVKGDRLRDLKRGKERIRLLRRCQEKKVAWALILRLYELPNVKKRKKKKKKRDTFVLYDLVEKKTLQISSGGKCNGHHQQAKAGVCESARACSRVFTFIFQDFNILCDIKERLGRQTLQFMWFVEKKRNDLCRHFMSDLQLTEETWFFF